MTRRDLESRIQDLVDGKLAPDERAALLDEIRDDPELLDIYWDYVVLDCAFSRFSRSAASLRSEQALITATGLRLRSTRRLRWSLGAAAAVLVMTGVTLRLVLSPDPPPVASLRMTSGSVLDVSHPPDGKKTPPPGTLVPGSRVALAQGALELTFASGVRSIVKGPADLTLWHESRLGLRKGTVWFHVPPAAAGFEVQTPGITVTDLGTEFGVRTRPHSLDEVHVFKGKVEVATHQGVKALETLAAGTARAAGLVGHLTEIPPDPAHFLATLPDSLPHLHWSFDDARMPGAATGSHPAARGKSANLAGLDDPAAFTAAEGRFGRAIGTTGAFAQATSRWDGVEGNAPRTISHWIKVKPGGTGAQEIVGWGSHAISSFNPNPAFLTYVRRIDNSVTVTGVSFGFYCLDGTTPLDDDRWHHFAVVYTGRQHSDGRPELFCYLDGRRETMTSLYRNDIAAPHELDAHKIATDLSSPDAIPVTIFPGNWTGDGRVANMPLTLDELYIFEAALDETQVMNLYQKNRKTE